LLAGAWSADQSVDIDCDRDSRSGRAARRQTDHGLAADSGAMGAGRSAVPRLLVVSIVAAALLAAGETHAKAQTYRERGAYLVNAVAVCGNCHTPREPR
jgi:mono/diheme cytochrome c family protein